MTKMAQRMRVQMRMKMRKKYSALIIACLLGCGILSGCQKAEMEVSITDGKATTKVAVPSGETVQQALERAEIRLSDKDQVEPELGASLTGKTAQVSIIRCAAVTVEENGQPTELEMTGETVGAALDQMGIALGEHDYVNHDLDAGLESGMHIVVTHRKEVTVSVDGETKTCLTRAENVEDFLAEQHIAVDKKDRINPGREADIDEGDKITVERVSVKEITVKEAIAFETETEYSNAMYSDETVEKTPGVEGEKEVTYNVTYVDGKEENRTVVSEKVLKEPVAQVVTRGTKQRRRVVSRQKVPDCDGSGHGYYVITWSDGTVEYQDY